MFNSGELKNDIHRQQQQKTPQSYYAMWEVMVIRVYDEGGEGKKIRKEMKHK